MDLDGSRQLAVTFIQELFGRQPFAVRRKMDVHANIEAHFGD